MRSLTSKLTLAFLLIGLTGALLVGVITAYRTRQAFDQFILNQEQESLKNGLVQYYRAKGSWDGVENNLILIFKEPPNQFNAAPHIIRGDLQHFSLIGPDRRVIFGRSPMLAGRLVSQKVIDNAYPLKVGGDEVGYLVVDIPQQRVWNANSPESLFLRRMVTSTVFSAAIAAGLALFLGGLMAFSMTRSLRELTDAADEIASGKLGKQVQVRTHDEFGELAQSFNKMSTDLAKATQSRRQMTADIAHDLRSPLSVISGYAEALSDGKLPGTPEVYDILHQETRHLSRLVDDLRTLSLADAGELALVLQRAHPQALLERVATRYSVAAQQRGITLNLVPAGDLPLVTIDIERITQVIDNLISNAFRYTPAGGAVTLFADHSDGMIRIHVRDNGSGISRDDLPYIFDRFYKGDKSRQNSEESGLGLAIAKSLVELHGGSIDVESELGKGSEFIISLRETVDR